MTQDGSPLRHLRPILVLLVTTLVSAVAVSTVQAEDVSPAVPPAASPELFKIEFEPDAYYTSLGMYLSLTKTPIPHVGEQDEKDLYLTLISGHTRRDSW